MENMEKLGTKDILKEVHEAAEKLQKKIDHRSYLLVNSESWEIGGTRQINDELQQPQHNISDFSEENNDQKSTTDYQLGHKSLSETVLNLGSVSMARTPSAPPSDHYNYAPWPFRMLFGGDVGKEEENKTYESASALSLATFVSLLIEFVARLQNVVDSFEELSEKAAFRDPVEVAMTVSSKKKRSGFCEGLLCCF